MNPNNSNQDYILGLPTPRLLKVYKNLRNQVSSMSDWDWAEYETTKDSFEDLTPEQRSILRQFTKLALDRYGHPVPNKLHKAYEIFTTVKLKDMVKTELNHREHVPRKADK